MKLGKQTSAKGLLAAATLGIFFLFISLIRASPQIDTAPAEPTSTGADYDQFFAPGAATAESPPPAATPKPHARTRAS